MYKYTLDNNDRQILAIDLVRDDISNLAVKSFSRSPTAPAFCGGDNNEFHHSFTVVSFTQQVVDYVKDPSGKTLKDLDPRPVERPYPIYSTDNLNNDLKFRLFLKTNRRRLQANDSALDLQHMGFYSLEI